MFGLVLTGLREEARYTKPNVFVETTLDYTLTYLSHLKGVQLQSFNATILADDDYYSSNPARRRGTFSKFGTTIHDAHKTGLGSSAALVSALVAAVLEFFVEDPGRRDRKSIHNLAQAAHCAAQGKVGSGFDVAAAVYGSCLYRRFTPTVLETLGDRSFAGFGERLHRCVADLDPDQRWDMTISNNAVKIPKSLLLLMCDVDCGSETPGMVRQVLAWRRENSSEASLLWAALQKGQDDLCGELTRLSSQDGLLMSDRENLRDIIQTVRSFVREMSHKSGVPIEPPVITELLDYCTALPGVIGGVAPGAGGYDAVALLVLNDSETIRDLEDRLSKWTSKKKDTQDATIGKVSLLSVRQDHQGVRSEDPARYQEWVTA